MLGKNGKTSHCDNGVNMDFYFVHNNLNVTDIDESVKFYSKALGLVCEDRIEEEGFIIVFMGDGRTSHKLELTYLKDKTGKYDLGDNEIHLAFKVKDFKGAYELHKAMGCICYVNKAMGIYFIVDPDGYWLEIIPEDRKEGSFLAEVEDASC